MSKNNTEAIKDIRKEVKTKVPWQVLLIVIALLVPIIGWIITKAEKAELKADASIQRVSKVEVDIGKIQTDIGWIREGLEKGDIKIISNVRQTK